MDINTHVYYNIDEYRDYELTFRRTYFFCLNPKKKAVCCCYVYRSHFFLPSLSAGRLHTLFFFFFFCFEIFLEWRARFFSTITPVIHYHVNEPRSLSSRIFRRLFSLSHRLVLGDFIITVTALVIWAS